MHLTETIRKYTAPFWATAPALAVCSVLTTGCPTASLRSSQVVADSISGFSGKQGANGWSYGYWNHTTDTDKNYSQTTDFQLLRHFGSDPINQLSTRPELGTGKLWTLQDGLYYTSLWAGGGHPNGTMDLGAHAQVEHWAVRRWVSTANGPVTISGHAAKVLATNWGGGVQTRIVVDGTTVFSAAIDNHGTNYSVNATIHSGSLVDFLIGPGLPDAYAIGVTTFTATIMQRTQSLYRTGGGNSNWSRCHELNEIRYRRSAPWRGLCAGDG